MQNRLAIVGTRNPLANVIPFRKFAPAPCLHPEHRPPMHIVLEPGTHEHVCPACGHRTVLNAPSIVW